jgi:hypothetical protein
MSHITFGKIRRFQPAGRAVAASEVVLTGQYSRRAETRFMMWAAAGLLTGFLAAAIECL